MPHVRQGSCLIPKVSLILRTPWWCSPAPVSQSGNHPPPGCLPGIPACRQSPAPARTDSPPRTRHTDKCPQTSAPQPVAAQSQRVTTRARSRTRHWLTSLRRQAQPVRKMCRGSSVRSACSPHCAACRRCHVSLRTKRPRLQPVRRRIWRAAKATSAPGWLAFRVPAPQLIDRLPRSALAG